MKKIYYLFFFKLILFFKSISDDGFEKAKSLIVVNTISVIVFMEMFIWWTIVTKSVLNISKLWFVIPLVIIVAFNYTNLITVQKTGKYETEFRNYPRDKNFIINLSVLLFIFLVLSSLLFSFYRLSLINWQSVDTIN